MLSDYNHSLQGAPTLHHGSSDSGVVFLQAGAPLLDAVSSQKDYLHCERPGKHRCKAMIVTLILVTLSAHAPEGYSSHCLSLC